HIDAVVVALVFRRREGEVVEGGIFGAEADQDCGGDGFVVLAEVGGEGGAGGGDEVFGPALGLADQGVARGFVVQAIQGVVELAVGGDGGLGESAGDEPAGVGA